MNTYKDIEAEEEMYDEEQDEKEPLDPFVLEILLQIFRKVFNVNHFFSKEELQLTPEHFIEKIMNNEMKDITKEIPHILIVKFAMNGTIFKILQNGTIITNIHVNIH